MSEGRNGRCDDHKPKNDVLSSVEWDGKKTATHPALMAPVSIIIVRVGLTESLTQALLIAVCCGS